MRFGGRVLARAERLLCAAACALFVLGTACSRAPRQPPAASAKPAAPEAATTATSAGMPDPVTDAPHDGRAGSTTLPDAQEKYVPSPPRDPSVRAALQAKYAESTPGEMRAVYDSLSEVLDAQRNKRFADKNLLLRDKDMRALENEVGWLAEKCGR
jgi:hypothetical protein